MFSLATDVFQVCVDVEEDILPYEIKRDQRTDTQA